MTFHMFGWTAEQDAERLPSEATEPRIDRDIHIAADGRFWTYAGNAKLFWSTYRDAELWIENELGIKAAFSRQAFVDPDQQPIAQPSKPDPIHRAIAAKPRHIGIITG